MTEPNRLNRMYRRRKLPQFVGPRGTQIGDLIKAGPIPLSDGDPAVAVRVFLASRSTIKHGSRTSGG